MTVLVTGGAGYVGAHVVRALLEAGRDVVVLDSLRTGVREAVPAETPLEKVDIRDASKVRAVVERHDVDACVHLAGLKNPGESMTTPNSYMDINVSGTAILLMALRESAVANLVFSSSCSVYGAAERLPVDEQSPTNPVSTYGFSKLAAEKVIAGYLVAGTLACVNLRYFNAAGADASGKIGENWDQTSNLIPLLCKAVLGQRPPVQIFGDDYDTPDGTALRDYTHVSDLARAHVLALDYLERGGAPTTLNLGRGKAYSVLEVVRELELVSGREVPHELAARRIGDPPTVWADTSLAAATLGWSSTMTLEEIVRSAWAWHHSTAR